MYDRVDEIRRLLNEWDFIGVFNPETNVDEYDCMIPPLLAKLASGASSSEIRRYLDDEICGHFGMSPALVGIGTIADRLVAWRQASGIEN